jgi:hypothetical protein
MIFKIEKYCILILVLFAVISCQKDEIPKEEEHTNTKEYNLSLSGSLTNSNVADLGASSFKLQLIKGEISLTDFDENNSHPNAQVFITEKNKNSFEFNNLQEAKYTLFASKRGYKVSRELIEILQNEPNVTSIRMEKGSSGFTGKLQILSEDGNDLSEIKINRNSTISVFFYLYNGKGTNESFGISHLHNEGYLGKSFIINDKIEHLYSDWIKEIKPRSGILEPNEIKLIEVVIDPIVYLLKEHSSCNVSINYDFGFSLSY